MATTVKTADKATTHNFFEQMYSVDCSSKIEKKNGLSYLSWAYAWAELMKRYPLSYSTVYENKDGWNYFTDGKTAWVKTGVTIVFEDGSKNEIIEYLPVMDARNKSIHVDSPAFDSFAVNKTIQRSITKAIAKVSGLGLSIYAGEDIPEALAPSVDELVAMVNKSNSREEFEAAYRTAQSYKMDKDPTFRQAALLISKKFPKSA